MLYYTNIVGQIYFHSITFQKTPTPQYIVDPTLGGSVSHGCVRLALADAKWLQEHVSYGSTIVSYNRPF